MARQSESHPGGQVAQDDSVISQPAPPAEPGRALRIAALVATAAGLTALTAGACVLSYEPIHHLAIQSGVSSRLASIYPLIFDALLVLAGCSVLALRGAGLVSRVYAWLCLLVLLAGLAGGGAVHAAGVRFSRKLGGVLAAVLPWVLVLIGFGLLLALLRYARLRRQAARASYSEQLTTPLPPAAPDVVTAGNASGPAVPAPRPGPAEAPVVQNPALAALAVARPQTEPATTPQPAVTPQPTMATQATAGTPKPAVAGTAGSGPGTPGQQTPVRAPVSPAGPAGRPAGAGLTKSGPAGELGQDQPGQSEPDQHEPDQSGPGQSGPGQSGPGQRKVPVRQADLQLRARIPRPAPASGRPPSAAGATPAGGHPAGGFVPPVGTRQPATAQPTPAAQAGTSPPATAQPAAAQPAAGTRSGTVPGSPAAGQSMPGRAGATPAETGTPPASPASAEAGSGLSAAPTETTGNDDENSPAGGPPAFWRQRSSPTPPDEK